MIQKNTYVTSKRYHQYDTACTSHKGKKGVIETNGSKQYNIWKISYLHEKILLLWSSNCMITRRSYLQCDTVCVFEVWGCNFVKQRICEMVSFLLGNYNIVVVFDDVDGCIQKIMRQKLVPRVIFVKKKF